jgi:hypothetical protein
MRRSFPVMRRSFPSPFFNAPLLPHLSFANAPLFPLNALLFPPRHDKA